MLLVKCLSHEEGCFRVVSAEDWRKKSKRKAKTSLHMRTKITLADINYSDEFLGKSGKGTKHIADNCSYDYILMLVTYLLSTLINCELHCIRGL